MYTPSAFALHIQPGDSLTPARVKVVVQCYAPDSDGRVFVTPECVVLEELEGYINGLQDDLDQLRERARRAFQHER